jgi:hypothetical protein
MRNIGHLPTFIFFHLWAVTGTRTGQIAAHMIGVSAEASMMLFMSGSDAAQATVIV